MCSGGAARSSEVRAPGAEQGSLVHEHQVQLGGSRAHELRASNHGAPASARTSELTGAGFAPSGQRELCTQR